MTIDEYVRKTSLSASKQVITHVISDAISAIVALSSSRRDETF